MTFCEIPVRPVWSRRAFGERPNRIRDEFDEDDNIGIVLAKAFSDFRPARTAALLNVPDEEFHAFWPRQGTTESAIVAAGLTRPQGRVNMRCHGSTLRLARSVISTSSSGETCQLFQILPGNYNWHQKLDR
jgi:hypothetical protein